MGDVVVADGFVQHDMDASPLFPRHEVPLTGMTRFAADPSLRDALRMAAPLALQDVMQTLPRADWLDLDFEQARVHQGLVVSGDRFVSRSAESAELQQRLPEALAVEMECAAMAQVCHDYGEAVKLVVVRSDPDLTEAAVRDHCKHNLTNYKHPRLVEFRSDLPKTPVGKVLRRELRDHP